MPDVIKLLPDSIANQIAAGEVIQRPASVVKELMENSIDAGSSIVKLVIKGAGKTLIQIIDNGCGMSDTDARMSFERHATSKIREAKDLFSIRTMGFRGEAMASIAAIAHVELRTRRMTDEVGTRILMEGSTVKLQEPCQCSEGTTISVKNLFFNVPARRNFLKSDTVEMRHIIDEFQRAALAHPEIFFSLHHNGSEMYHLPKGNMRQRIVGILGQGANKKLVPVEEDTDIVKIKGYVGKAEFARKTRGEQFFFVNNRFIKSGYLNHAVMTAFEDLLPKDTHPLYVLYLDIDPARIDINVHPTKQEIKFDDERLIYNYLKVTIRHALAQYNVTPTLDFDTDPNFSGLSQKPSYPKAQTYKSRSTYGGDSSLPKEEKTRMDNNLKNWRKIYEEDSEVFDTDDDAPQTSITLSSGVNSEENKEESRQELSKSEKKPYQIHRTYIVSHIRSGFMLIDQQSAHERILYERFLKALENQETVTQKELFPETIQVSPADAEILRNITGELQLLGFDVRDFGNDTFVVHGIPSGQSSGVKTQDLLEKLLEQYKNGLGLNTNLKENLAASLAYGASVKRGMALQKEEMREIIDQLFACSMPYKSPSGKDCFVTYDLESLAKRFGH